jgi:hypothetical protein
LPPGSCRTRVVSASQSFASSSPAMHTHTHTHTSVNTATAIIGPRSCAQRRLT